MKNRFRVLVALMLAVMVVFTSVAALGDDPTDNPQTGLVINPDNNQTKDEYSYGNSDQDLAYVIVTDINQGDKANVTADDIITTSSQIKDDGLTVSNNHGTVNVNVDQIKTQDDGINVESNAGEINVDVGQISGDDKGIEITTNSGTIDVQANIIFGDAGEGVYIGPVSASSEEPSNTSNHAITIAALQIASANDDAVEIVNNAGTVNINQITNKQIGMPDTDSATKNGINIQNNTGTINLNQDTNKATPGNVTGETTGINIDGNAGTLNLTANKVEGEGAYSAGLTVNGATTNSDINLTVKEIAGGYDGIYVEAGSGTLDVKAEEISGFIGIRIDTVDSNNDFNLTANVNEICGSGGGINVIGNQSHETNITVNGLVKAMQGNTEGTISAVILKGPSKTTVQANETSAIVTGSGNRAFGLYVYGGTAIIGANEEATGNVTAISNEGAAATGLMLSSDEQKNIIIEGTLYGDTEAVQLKNNATENNSNLTVWELATGEGGTLISGDDAKGSFAATINYIVKLASALTGATVKGTGTVTIGAGDDARTLQTAKETDKVTVSNYTIAEGSVLDGVYYQDEGEEKVEVAEGDWGKNEDGSFWVKMLKGGGMMLGLKTHKHNEVPDAAVAATCTAAGKTAGSHCSICNAVSKAQTAVPAKGHSPAAAVKENEKAAKVGVAGSYDEVVYCRDCGAEISRKTVTVPALPESVQEAEKQEQAANTVVAPAYSETKATQNVAGLKISNSHGTNTINLRYSFEHSDGRASKMELTGYKDINNRSAAAKTGLDNAAAAKGLTTCFYFRFISGAKKTTGRLTIELPEDLQLANREVYLIAYENGGGTIVYENSKKAPAGYFVADIDTTAYWFCICVR